MYFACYVGFACYGHFHFQRLEENMVHIMFLNLLKGEKKNTTVLRSTCMATPRLLH